MVHAEVFVRSAGGFDDLLDGTRKRAGSPEKEPTLSELAYQTRVAAQT